MKYDKTIVFRLSEKDKALILAVAEKNNTTVGDYLRTLIKKNL